jgi:hypothetical protein
VEVAGGEAEGASAAGGVGGRRAQPDPAATRPPHSNLIRDALRPTSAASSPSLLGAPLRPPAAPHLLAPPRARPAPMSSDRAAALQARVHADPHDAAGWEALLGELARGRRSPEQAAALRAAYEELLARFPTAAAYWRELAELELASGAPDAPRALFARCLLACPDPELFRAYVRFVRRGGGAPGGAPAPEARAALEFALDRVGQDARAGPLWEEYAALLAAPRPASAEYAALYGADPPGQEGAARVAALRRAYHRALEVPHAALDALWAGYERFEAGTGDRTLAKRALDEWRPRFQAARALARERAALVERAAAGRALPLAPGRGGARAARAAGAWRALVAWERGNPQGLDAAALRARVQLAYDQALAAMPQHPEAWLDLAAWHARGGGGGAEAAADALRRGARAAPAALALRLAEAEAEEDAGRPDAARAVFEELVAGLDAPPKAAAAAAAAAAAEPAGGGAEAPAGEAAAAPAVAAPPAAAAAEGAAAAPAADAAAAPAADAAAAPAADAAAAPAADAAAAAAPQPRPPLSPEAGTLAWIQYMRFARRAGGITAARRLFLRARRWPALRWEAFAAAASLEWAHEAKDAVPRNIFELGARAHLREPAFVLAYAAFLRGAGDAPAARALFERAVAAAPPGPAAAPLWDAYLALEAEAGTRAAAAEVAARRRAAAGGAGGPAAEAAEAAAKWRFLGLWPGDAAFAAVAAGGEGAEAEEAEGSGGGEGGARRGAARGARPRSRSRSRSPGARREAPPAQLRVPRELAALLNSLPRAPDGPVPDPARVSDAILRADFSAEGVEAHEAAAARERRRQRHAAERAAGGGGPPGAPPGGGFGAGGAKRPAPAYDSESGSSGEEGGGRGQDVYRRRMRARV